jgi:hypothetical protein
MSARTAISALAAWLLGAAAAPAQLPPLPDSVRWQPAREPAVTPPLPPPVNKTVFMPPTVNNTAVQPSLPPALNNTAVTPSLPAPAVNKTVFTPSVLPPAASETAITPPLPLPPARRVQSALGREATQEGEGITYPAQPPKVKTVGVMSRKSATEEDIDFAIRPELPDIIALTQRISEAHMLETWRQDARKRPGTGRIYFPTEPVIGREPYAGRQFHNMLESVEPSYVCHRRLLFEQPNFERYGWSLGAVQPVAHLLVFYYDMAMLPYHLWDRPCEDFDCTVGKCLPGDPTPLYLWRERFSLSGMAAEIGTFGIPAFWFH